MHHLQVGKLEAQLKQLLNRPQGSPDIEPANLTETPLAQTYDDLLAAAQAQNPELAGAVVPIGLALIAAMVLVNLRGVKEAGTVFAAPTYIYLVAILGLGLERACELCVDLDVNLSWGSNWAEAKG